MHLHMFHKQFLVPLNPVMSLYKRNYRLNYTWHTGPCYALSYWGIKQATTIYQGTVAKNTEDFLIVNTTIKKKVLCYTWKLLDMVSLHLCSWSHVFHKQNIVCENGCDHATLWLTPILLSFIWKHYRTRVWWGHIERGSNFCGWFPSFYTSQNG